MKAFCVFVSLAPGSDVTVHCSAHANTVCDTHKASKDEGNLQAVSLSCMYFASTAVVISDVKCRAVPPRHEMRLIDCHRLWLRERQTCSKCFSRLPHNLM